MSFDKARKMAIDILVNAEQKRIEAAETEAKRNGCPACAAKDKALAMADEMAEWMAQRHQYIPTELVRRFRAAREATR